MGGRKRMSKSITTRLTREPGSIPGQGSTLNGGWGQHAQATTTQTTTATGLGTCLAKSSSGSTGSKMNPTIINLKIASPLCQTTTILDPTTSIGTTSHVMILPD